MARFQAWQRSHGSYWRSVAPAGRKLVALDPSGRPGERRKSLEVDPNKQLWIWYSQTPGPGQKFPGGDEDETNSCNFTQG